MSLRLALAVNYAPLVEYFSIWIFVYRDGCDRPILCLEERAPMVHPELVHQIPHFIETAVVGGVGVLGKYFGSKVLDEWKEVKEKLDTIATSTQVSAENHLLHIERESEKQTALLEKVVENQAELNGFLKGQAVARSRRK